MCLQLVRVVKGFFAMRSVMSQVPVGNQLVNAKPTSFPGSLFFPSRVAEGKKGDPGSEVDDTLY